MRYAAFSAVAELTV